MEGIMKFTDYKQFKGEFDREIGRQAEGFVRMGYLLKIARDTDILYGSGYKSIAEFAWGEYRLPDYTVTNMIKINDRYSEGGYSGKLAERYRGFGSSLLAEMLTLSDEVVDALPPGTKREEIRGIKNEIKEEQKVTDLEVLLEEPEQEAGDNLEKVLRKYYYENRREYMPLHRLILDGELTERAALELLAPNGTAVKFARVSGVGKFMVSIKGGDQDIELLNVRTNEAEKYPWEACVRALRRLFRGSRDPGRDWESIYGEPFRTEEKQEAGAEGKQREEKKPEAGNRGNASKAAGKPEAPDRGSKAAGKPEVAPAQKPGEVPVPEPEEKTETMPEPQAPEPQAPEPQEQEFEKPEEAVQQEIGEYKDVLPEGYQPGIPEVVTSEEAGLWKDAAQHAERLFNTLDAHGWNPDCGKLVREMCREADELCRKLGQLDACMNRRDMDN